MEINHYLDPNDLDFNRDYWSLIESGVDNDLIVWSYKSDVSTNPCTVPPLINIDSDTNITHTPIQNSIAELSTEGGKDKCNNISLGATNYVYHYAYNKAIKNNNHVDGRHYLNTNNPNFAKDHFNLLELGVG